MTKGQKRRYDNMGNEQLEAKAKELKQAIAELQKMGSKTIGVIFEEYRYIRELLK